MYKQTLFKNYNFGLINHGQQFKNFTTRKKSWNDGNILMKTGEIEKTRK